MSAEEILIRALRGTYSGGPAELKQAEEVLKSYEGSVGYARALVMVLARGDLEVPTKVAAAVALKNCVKRKYSAQAENCLCEEDKAYLRMTVLDALCASPLLVRKQLAVCMEYMSKADFPERWPDLLDRIMAAMASQNLNNMSGALLALYAVLKNYSFLTSTDEREHAIRTNIMERSFPVLISLSKLIMAQPFTVESVGISHYLLKVLWSIAQGSLPPFLENKDRLNEWLVFIVTVLGAATSPCPISHVDLWWKMVRRAITIMSRWLYRFGKPSDIRRPETVAAVVNFNKDFAPKTVEICMQLIANAKAINLPDMICYLAFSFMSASCQYKTTYAFMKPHIPTIVQNLAFPHLCYNQEDIDLITDDPIEYIRREFECSDATFFVPRTAAAHVVLDICRYRSKDNLLGVMQFLAATFHRATSTGDMPTKFGALMLVTSLSRKICRTDPYRQQLEPMITAHVLPEMQSPNPLIRAMAVWTFAHFMTVKFANTTVFTQAITRVLQLTNDPNIAVRAFAAVSLRDIVQSDIGKEVLRPHLSAIVNMLFGFIDMQELDLDDLVNTLTIFVDAYGADLGPFAAEICARLVKNFEFMVQTIQQSDEIDENVFMKAQALLETLGTILEAIHGVPDLFVSVCQAIMPLVTYVIVNFEPMEEFLVDVFSIFQTMTFYAQPFPAFFWNLFPHLVQMMMKCDPDYLGEMIGPLDNFISRSGDVFLSNPQYLESIFAIINRFISDEGVGEIECLKACQLAEVVIQHHMGKVDQFVTRIIDIVCRRLAVAKMVVFKVLLVEVIANCIIYNASATLNYLASTNNLVPVFTMWHSLKDQFARLYDKKIAVIALSSIFKLPFAQLPPVMQGQVQVLIVDILDYLKAMEKQKRKIAKQEELYGDYDSEDEIEKLMMQDDGDVEDDDETGEEPWEDAQDDGDVVDDDEDDDFCFDDEGDEEFLDLDEEDVYSPLREVDEIFLFIVTAQDCMEGATACEQYRQAFLTLPKERQTEIQRWINVAREHQQKSKK